MPATARRARIARPTIASPTATKIVPWTCELAESFSPSGLQRSHRPTSRATGAPQRAQGWVGAAGGSCAIGLDVGVVIARPSCHERGRGPSGRGCVRPAYHRSAARTRASTSAVVRAVRRTSSAPASSQRASSSRGATRSGSAASGSAPRLRRTTEPQDDPLIGSLPARGGEGFAVARLEIEERVRLRGPAVADLRGDADAGRRAGPDQDRRRRFGDRIGVGLEERVEAAAERDRAAGPERPKHSDGLAEAERPLLRWREGNSVRLVLGRMPADPDPDDEPPVARRLEHRGHPGEDRGVAVHDVRHERSDGDPLGDHRRRRQRRPGLQDRIGLHPSTDEVVPRPDAGITGRIEAPGAVEPPADIDPDRAQDHPDRQAFGHRLVPHGQCGSGHRQLAKLAPRERKPRSAAAIRPADARLRIKAGLERPETACEGRIPPDVSANVLPAQIWRDRGPRRATTAPLPYSPVRNRRMSSGAVT